MEVASGGKKAEIADIGHLVLRHGMGSTQEFQGHFMFPSAGNTSGFVRNYPDWSTFWNLHGTTTTDIAHMGINTTDAPFTNNIFFSRSGPTVDKVTAAANVVYDQWYSYRVSVKYSTTSDGLLQFWLDGVQLADWPGATVPVGDNPYLQYGFYADIFFSNEVRHGGMKVIG
jgi:hypothetical protein